MNPIQRTRHREDTGHLFECPMPVRRERGSDSAFKTASIVFQRVPGTAEAAGRNSGAARCRSERSPWTRRKTATTTTTTTTRTWMKETIRPTRHRPCRLDSLVPLCGSTSISVNRYPVRKQDHLAESCPFGEAVASLRSSDPPPPPSAPSPDSLYGFRNFLCSPVSFQLTPTTLPFHAFILRLLLVARVLWVLLPGCVLLKARLNAS